MSTKKFKLYTPVELHIGEDYVDLYGIDPQAEFPDHEEPRLLRFTGHPSDDQDLDFANATATALNSHQGLYDCLLWHHENCQQTEPGYHKTAVFRATRAALEAAEGKE